MVHVIPESGFANTWLIEEDDGLIAVDVGSIGAAQEVAKYCAGILKKPLEDIRFIFATHFHIDHIGGIGALLKECSPETRVMFDLQAKEYIEGRENLAPMKNWLCGLVPVISENYARIGNLSHLAFESLVGVPLPGCGSLGSLPYADRIAYIDMRGALSGRIGFADWEAVPTPGHTPDSLSLYREKTQELICGDLILGRRDGTGYLNRFCWDEDRAIDRFVILNSSLDVRKIYPGHGKVIRDHRSAFTKIDPFPKKERKQAWTISPN